ncbi:MAG: ATP-binding cassette domain-containing protein [Firmicutes bacterium]|nr:ATP-binding cassette domain-containing protein [Bacillota bacterium]
MSQIMIETENLHYQYPDGTPALAGISLQIEQGKKFAVLGSNGAGKSTLFLHWNGILRPAKGSVYYKGNMVKYNHKALLQLRQKVGIVFQDPDTQLFSASVYQEVSFGALNLGLPEDVVKERVERALEATEIMHLLDRPTQFLSYGQKKMVAIADILAMEPEVIILDEPTAYLDPLYTKKTMALLDRLQQQGVTIILSTHDVNMAYAWADEILVMKAGKLITQGRPEYIFSDHLLLEDTNLTKPLILEMYEELHRVGHLDPSLTKPRNKQELFGLLRK